MAFDNDGCRIARVGLGRVIRSGQINAKVRFDPRGFASGGEVGAHDLLGADTCRNLRILCDLTDKTSKK